MFDIFFGWRKASKCKKLVKRVQSRLKLLRNKRSSIARLVRDDMVQLILAGHEDTALNRAEQLCNDLSLISAYELLDQFCKFVLVRLSYIRRHKDLPNDINEAVSSLIFASARCGDLPELRGIRKLFAERYGQRFATTAAELFPGNLVNHQIIEKLSAKAVPNELKQNLFDEIARGCSLNPDILALEYASELQKQEKETGKNQIMDKYLLTYYNEIQGCQFQYSSAKEIEGAARSLDSSSVGNKCSSRSCQTSRQNSDMTSTSVSSSILPQSSHDMSESPIYNEEEELYNQSQEAGMTHAINSAPFPEENLKYLDDIEEFESPKTKNQRLFMFKPSKKVSYKNNEKDQTLMSRESQSMDTECFVYHGELVTLKLRTRHDHVAAVYDVFTYPDMRGESSYGTRKEMVAPPCRRAATMPQERHKDSSGGNIQRFNSCPYKHPSHVHPKLPDYNDIAAKFMALKKDHQNKVSDTET